MLYLFLTSLDRLSNFHWFLEKSRLAAAISDTIFGSAMMSASNEGRVHVFDCAVKLMLTLSNHIQVVLSLWPVS